jgi:hypothetical protein
MSSDEGDKVYPDSEESDEGRQAEKRAKTDSNMQVNSIILHALP